MKGHGTCPSLDAMDIVRWECIQPWLRFLKLQLVWWEQLHIWGGNKDQFHSWEEGICQKSLGNDQGQQIPERLLCHMPLVPSVNLEAQMVRPDVVSSVAIPILDVIAMRIWFECLPQPFCPLISVLALPPCGFNDITLKILDWLGFEPRVD